MLVELFANAVSTSWQDWHNLNRPRQHPSPNHEVTQHFSLAPSPEFGLLRALQKRIRQIHTRALILQAHISVIVRSHLSATLLSASSTGLLTANCSVLEKLVVTQPLKRFPFYGIQQVHYHVHKRPQQVRIRSQMYPIHTHILFLRVHFNIMFPSTSRFSFWSLL
jgi:hypothetical protein